jgi:hypothetical protein
MFQQYLRLQPVATQSQVPLSKQVPERYSTVLEIGEDSKILDFKTDTFKDYLKKDAEDAATRLPAPTLHEAEVSLVKRMLRTHLYNATGSHDTFDRFGFDGFFDDKGKPQSTPIHLPSPSDRALQATMACLVAICDMSSSDDFSKLQEYGWAWFAYHFEGIQTDQADVPRLQEIGRRVVRILYDADMIDMWLDKRSLEEPADDWFFAKAMFNLLSNNKVQTGLASMPSESRWVLSITSKEGASVQLLERVAKRKAERWLSDGDQKDIAWLHGFLCNVSVIDHPFPVTD